MEDQIVFLTNRDEELREAIKSIQQEEIEHRDSAREKMENTVFAKCFNYFVENVTHLAIVVAYHS